VSDEYFNGLDLVTMTGKLSIINGKPVHLNAFMLPLESNNPPTLFSWPIDGGFRSISLVPI